MNNKIIDLFCGHGGLSKGFEKAGFEVKIAIDMWEDAVITYNRNHKKPVAQCHDIHTWDDKYLDEIKKKVSLVLLEDLHAKDIALLEQEI